MHVGFFKRGVGYGEPVRRALSSRRSIWSRCLLLACVLLGIPLLCGTPALALSQRGHVLSFSFAGSGEGQLAKPTAVAVDNASGEVYVAAHRPNRVEQFKPTFSEAGTLTGEEWVRSFAVPSLEGLAVDNSQEGSDPSAGDVYAVSQGKKIYKFSDEGVQLGEVREWGNTKLAGVAGVAVDPSGALFVWQEDGEIYQFNDAAQNQSELSFATSLQGTPGFAVDSGDDFLLAVQGGIIKELENLTLAPLIEAFPLPGPANAVAVNRRHVPANGVDEEDDVYLDSTTEELGERRSAIEQFAPEASGKPGALLQSLEADGLTNAAGVAVNEQTGTVYATDASSNQVYVFNLEEPGLPAIEALAASAATSPAAGARRLSASVNPDGSDTSYRFEYGTKACASTPSACTSTVPADLGGAFGAQEVGLELNDLAPGVYHYRVVAENEFAHGSSSSFSAERTFSILAQLTGLPDGRAWELVSPAEAHNAHVEGMAREGGLILASEDGDALTYLVTGVIAEEEQANRSPEKQQVIATRSSSGWISQDIATPSAKEQGANIGQGPEYQYFSSDLSLGIVDPYQEEPRSSPPLAPAAEQTTVYLRDNPPITPGQAEQSAYEEAAANSGFLAPGFVPLVSEGNTLAGTQFGGGIEFQGATPDLSHVILRSNVALAGGGSAAGLYEWSVGHLKYISTYEGSPAPEAELGHDGLLVAHAISNDGTRVVWSAPVSNPHLYLTDTVTGKTVRLDQAQGVSEPTTGGAFFQSASPDGSHVLFTSTEPLTKGSTANANERDEDLYECEITETTGQPACSLADLTTSVSRSGEHASVQGLSGSSEGAGDVYLVATGVLTSSENERGEKARTGEDNLYELHRVGTGPAWTTTFVVTLSGEDHPDWAGSSNSANTAFLTARVSPNGRYLAFMSQGSLTGYDNEDLSSLKTGERMDEEVFLFDATTHSVSCVSCNPTGERPTGVLDKAESGEGFGLLADGRGAWTGHWLAGSLPGWTARSLSRALVQSRYLSNEGRLFFDSADPLVSGMAASSREENVNGKPQLVGVENVYEYEPASVGSCGASAGCLTALSDGSSEHESTFLEATPSGDDVFFLTSAKLSPQDLEGAPTIYDARVCTKPSPCLTAPAESSGPCESVETCHLPSAPQGAGAGAPASAKTSSSGNIVPPPPAKQEVKPSKTVAKPLTTAQKLAKALAACRRAHPHSASKRKACEAHARKLYAPRKGAKKK